MEVVKSSPLLADLLEFNDPTKVKPEIKLEPETEKPQQETDQQTIHVCDTCSKMFSHQYQLEDHKLLEHSGETKPYVCFLCDELFTTQIALDEHKFSKHVDQKPNVCPICYEIFASRSCY